MTPSTIQGPHDTVKPPSRRGTWVVVALLLLGTAAGVVTVSFWTVRGRQHIAETDQDVADDAGSALWDQRAADAELDQLMQSFERIATANQSAAALVPAAERLVERYPRYAPIRTFLGQVWLYGGQIEAAYDQFELSLELDGQQPDVHLLSGTIAYKLDRLDQATGHYSMAVGMEPSNPTYRLHLAQAYLRQQKTDAARDVLLEALRVDSSLHEAYAGLADIYTRQNKLALALTQVQKAIEHTPASERATQVLYIRQKAQLLRRDNRAEEALLTLQDLTVREQADAGVLEEMATCLALLGRPDRAAELFEQAMAADPTQWTLVAGAARWRLKCGDKAAARQHLELLRQINPRSPVIGLLQSELE